jgi:hypothetical protein
MTNSPSALTACSSRPRIDPSTVGILLCLLSAVGYTCYNVCLPGVSVECDPVWVNCVQAAMCVVGISPFLIFGAWRGQPVLPPWRELIALAVLGLVAQIGGILFVFGSGSVGLAITAPLQTGIVLLGSVILGQLLLGENVTARSLLACTLITACVLFFGFGGDEASKAIQQSMHAGIVGNTDIAIAAPSTPDVLTAIGAACLSGAAFSATSFIGRGTESSLPAAEAIASRTTSSSNRCAE